MPTFQNVIPKTDCFSVEQFLLQHNPLVIPQWQRGYSWEAEQIDDFMEDLFTFFSENKEREFRKPSYYLLGQVITVGNERDEFELVDGQQRLTTLYLLLIVLYRKLSKLTSNGEKLNYVRGLIQLRICTQISGRIVLNLKSLYQDGTKVLEYLLKQGLEDFEQVGELTIAQENIKNSYDKIEDLIDKTFDNETDLIDYANLILSNVMFARLELSSIQSAIDAFEKMNNRGMELEDSDLLKNYLFKKIQEDKYDKLTENWTKLSKNISAIHKKQKGLRSEGTFIKYLGISESAKKINSTKQLFDYFENTYTTPDSLLQYSESLPEISKFYKDICNFSLDPNNSNYDHNKMYASKYLRAVQTIPVLLAARKLKNYNTLSQLIDNRYAIYILGKERTQDFESLIPRLVKSVNELPYDASSEFIIESINSDLGFINTEMVEQIKTGIKSLTYQKNSNKTKMRFILAKVNRYLDDKAKFGDCNKSLDEYMKTRSRSNQLDGIDLDHILAQQYLHDFTDSDKKIMNEIGAVTFVHASEHQQGPDIADAYPIDKSGLYSQSRYVLTKALVQNHNVTPKLQEVLDEIKLSLKPNLEKWSTSDVLERTDFIISLYMKTLRSENIRIPETNT